VDELGHWFAERLPSERGPRDADEMRSSVGIDALRA